MSSLRIGINALYLIPGGVGGTEIYLREMVRAFESLGTRHEFLVLTNVETGRLGEHCVELPVRGSFRPGRILYEQIALPGILRRERVDVLLNPGYTAPMLAPCPQVTVFHDLQHKRHPENFRWFDLPAWQFFLWQAAKRSSRVIASSEATRADLMRYYGLPAERVTMVHLGVGDEFFGLGSRREDGGYILCASTTHPHKNHPRLLRSFARLRAERPQARLVLTGVRGFAEDGVHSVVKELGLEDSVESRGWVPREELHELFRRATAFVYPSTFEGFGIPVLEALAAGLPTACSNIEPLRTIAGGAALLFDPEDEESILDALRSLLDGRAPAGGPERAAGFTWRRCAAQTLGVIEGSLRA